MTAFTNEDFMSISDKQLVLTEWQRFVRSGFEFHTFSEPLYKHLHLHAGFTAHYDRQTFWVDFFDNTADALATFLLQFGTQGGGKPAQGFLAFWMSGTASDLNLAMCDFLAPLFPALEQTLTRIAATAYEQEKWLALKEKAAQFGHSSSQQLAHLSCNLLVV